MSWWKTTHVKSHVIFEMNKSVNKNAFYLGDVYLGRGAHYPLRIPLLKKWIKVVSTWGGSHLLSFYMRVDTLSFHAWINTYTLWTEWHTWHTGAKALSFPKLCLCVLKIDFFLGLNSSVQVLCKRTVDTYWETGFGRPCFFFLDNAITCFECLKKADLLRRLQGIYIPLIKIVIVSGVLINYRSLCLPNDRVCCAISTIIRLLHSADSIMCMWISRQNIVPLVAIKFLGNNLFNKFWMNMLRDMQ